MSSMLKKALLAIKLLIILNLCDRILGVTIPVKNGTLVDFKAALSHDLSIQNKNLTLNDVLTKCTTQNENEVTEYYKLLVVDKNKLRLQECILGTTYDLSNTQQSKFLTCDNFRVRMCKLPIFSINNCTVDLNLCDLQCRPTDGVAAPQLNTQKCVKLLEELGHNKRQIDGCNLVNYEESTGHCQLSNIEIILMAPNATSHERQVTTRELRSVWPFLNREFLDVGIKSHRLMTILDIPHKVTNGNRVLEYSAVLWIEDLKKPKGFTIRRVFNFDGKPTITFDVIQIPNSKNIK